DTADPTVLQYDYVRALAAVVDASFPDRETLEAYHLGGGGLTFPRYLAEVRPGTRSVVSEIDGGVVGLDRDEFGELAGTGIDIRVEDGRLGLQRLDTDTRDLVVGDAFGGVSVPWHLTTVEALSGIQRVLAPGGVYAANLIDHGELAFARAEVATVAEVFDHVALLGEPTDLAAGPATERGGNFVVVASDRPISVPALREGLAARDTGWTAISGDDLARWIGDTQVLTDDHAPVDQLLEPFGSSR
ncbi:fused MFS/spermidine synthase, partial [Mycobacterium sp. PO2]